MEYFTVSGICIALLVGSIIYETRNLKKEKRRVIARIMSLYENHKLDY